MNPVWPGLFEVLVGFKGPNLSMFKESKLADIPSVSFVPRTKCNTGVVTPGRRGREITLGNHPPFF